MKTPTLLFLLASIASIAFAQQTGPEITFLRQPSPIDGIDEYEIAVCNRSSAPMQVDPVGVRVYAFQAGITAVSHANLLRAVESMNRRSPLRYALLATEISSWALSAVVAFDTVNEEGEHTGPIRIDSRWKALFPVGASLLSFGRYMIDRESRPAALPGNLLPLFPFGVPANLCHSYAFHGVPK